MINFGQRTEPVLWIPTLVATLTLYWIYDGYGRFLQLLNAVRRLRPARGEAADSPENAEWPSITILLTVHNEEAVVQGRIENMLECDYPADQLSIVVASDGSTDETNNIVRSFSNRRVKLFESPGLGKTGTQNAAIRGIESDIIAFTDADILFDEAYLKHVALRFRDPGVGAVDGRQLYGVPAADSIQVNHGYYWNYELKLRFLESQLGILAVVAGACFSVRRKLFVPMDPAIGEDCIVPLDVAVQGYRVVHDPLAIAWHKFGEDSSITLRRRIRMTLRNWQGTWTRSQLLNPFLHPGYAFALWSHKLLRWLSPVFLATASFCAVAMLILEPNLISAAIFAPFGLLFVMAALGWLSAGRRLRIPGAGSAYSFVLANMAFLIGIWRAITGQRIHSYRNS